MFGIICNYYVKNYGSALQSIALQMKLDQLGIPNEIINFQEKVNFRSKIEIIFRIKLQNILDINKITEKVSQRNALANDLIYSETIEKRTRVFDDFLNQKLRLSTKMNDISDIVNAAKTYEGVILGSDQLWCPSDLIINYHTLSFLPDDIYKVTYATSFGVESLKPWMKRIVKEFIPRINHISVREESGVRIIESLCQKKVHRVLDPTLLITRDEWDTNLNGNIVSVDKKYIFCYFLSTNPKLKVWAKELHEKTGYMILSIPFLESYNVEDKNFSDENRSEVNPFQLIQLIKSAEYVLSDSFHVTVFSIIYEKQFLVFDRYKNNSLDSRNTRIENLLSMLGLHRRRYNGEGNIHEKITSIIDYNEVTEKLNKERDGSISYLMDVLIGR